MGAFAEAENEKLLKLKQNENSKNYKSKQKRFLGNNEM